MKAIDFTVSEHNSVSIVFIFSQLKLIMCSKGANRDYRYPASAFFVFTDRYGENGDTVICNGIKVVEKQKFTLVDEAEKRDYTNKIGKEFLTKASSRIPVLKDDIK